MCTAKTTNFMIPTSSCDIAGHCGSRASKESAVNGSFRLTHRWDPLGTFGMAGHHQSSHMIQRLRVTLFNDTASSQRVTCNVIYGLVFLACWQHCNKNRSIRITKGCPKLTRFWAHCVEFVKQLDSSSHLLMTL